MKFLIDNALSIYLAIGLRNQGYDALHVTEVGLGDASDSTILALADTEDRIVVTTDNDFPQLMAIYRKPKPSIILFRLEASFVPPQQFELLVSAFEGMEDSLLIGCIATIKAQSIRIRMLPIGPIN